MKKNIILTGVFAVTMIIMVCGLTGCSNERPVDEVELQVPVTVTKVKEIDVEDRIVATGTLRASRVAILNVETEGVLEILADKNGRRYQEGDKVKAGDAIARITGDNIRLAVRKVATLKKYEKAKDDYESTKKLFDDGFKSKSELLQAQSALEDAKINYESSLKTEKRSTLITPIDGVIIRLARDRDNQNQPLAVGQYVSVNSEVARIAPTDKLIADVDLVAQDVARVTEGLKARVEHYAWKDETFDGKVIRLAPVIDPVTRALKAEVEVDNSEGKLRSGMFVEVTIVKEVRKNVPSVPREAVINRGGKWVVFLLSGQRVAMKQVITGLGDDNVMEIRSGLSVGEKVVTRGLETLSDQTRVRVTENN